MRKRVVGFLGTLLAVLFVAVSVCACAKSGVVTSAKVLEKSENLVVIQVEKCENGATVYDALVFLKEKGALAFTSETSTFGQSLLSLNGKNNPADWSSYWQFYTGNLEQGNPDKSKTFGEYTVYYASVGISSATVQNGGVYLFEFAVSEW